MTEEFEDNNTGAAVAVAEGMKAERAAMLEEIRGLAEQDERENELSPIEKVFNQENEIIYDANAQQRYGFLMDDEIEVEYIFSPISGERYFEFDRNSRLKLVDDGASIVSDNAKALVKLFDDTVLDIEGIEGDKPANWKDELDADKEKIPAISAFLTVAAFTDAKRVWGQTDSSVTTESYFSGKKTTQKHFLRKKTSEDVRDYRRFQKIPLATKSKGLTSGETVMPSNGEGKANLYDRMVIKEATGYKNVVPAWHKIAVIDHIFSSGLTQKK